jgi:hypothetical protein
LIPRRNLLALLLALHFLMESCSAANQSKLVSRHGIVWKRLRLIFCCSSSQMVSLVIGAGIQTVEYQRLNPPKCQRAFV